jgi:CheY-like chemotaxis protein
VLDKDLRGALVEVALRLREVTDYAEAEYAASGYGVATLPMLDEVGADLEQLTTLAADVVDFQQSVLGNLEYEPETAALLGVVDAAVSAVAPAAGAAGVEIAAHCSDVEVDLDVALFVKLLAHLLADMVSVSPVGGKIVVTAARRGTLARIEIRGPHTGGGPLHLPIAQAIAAKHGGTVTTHRIAGKGNTHVVEVPVTQPNMPDRPAKPKAVEGPVRPTLPTRVRQAGQRANAIAAAHSTEPNAVTAGTSPAPTALPKTTAAGVPTAAANDEAAADEQPAAESPQAEEQPTSRRRRHAPSAADLQARIPAQSRSTLGRSVGSIADLRPTRPMPTGDVWSKPDRALTSDPAPELLEPLEPLEQAPNTQAAGPVEAPAPTIPEVPEPAPVPAEPVQPIPPTQPAPPVQYSQPWQLGESRPAEPAAAPPAPAPQPVQQPARPHVQPWQLADDDDDEPDLTQRMPQLWQLEPQPAVAQPTPAPQPAPAPAPQPVPVAQAAPVRQPEPESLYHVPPVPPEAEQMQPPAYVAATHATLPRGRRRAATQDAETTEPLAPEPPAQPAPQAVALPERVTPVQPAAVAEPVRQQLQPVAQPLPPATTQYQPIQQAESRAALPAPTGYAALPERVTPAVVQCPSQPRPRRPPRRNPRRRSRARGCCCGRTRTRRPICCCASAGTNRWLSANRTSSPRWSPTAPASRIRSRCSSTRSRPRSPGAACARCAPRRPRRGFRCWSRRASGARLDGGELGPDPSLLLTALLPAEVRVPRVLLVEARPDLGDALADILERQGMQVTHATTDAESREAAVASPPDLVLLDLMQIRRRRVGVVDWLRDRGLLARTPLVVYTAEGSDTGGFESLYLTERATDAEPAGRLGDLLSKIAP